MSEAPTVRPELTTAECVEIAQSLLDEHQPLHGSVMCRTCRFPYPCVVSKSIMRAIERANLPPAEPHPEQRPI